MKTTFKALILLLSGAPVLLAGATYQMPITAPQNVETMRLTQEQVQIQARMQAQMMAEMAKMQAESIAQTATAQSEALAKTATAQSEAMIHTFEAMAQATKAMAQTFSQMAESMGSAYTSVSAPWMNMPLVNVPMEAEKTVNEEVLHSSAPEVMGVEEVLTPVIEEVEEIQEVPVIEESVTPAIEEKMEVLPLIEEAVIEEAVEEVIEEVIEEEPTLDEEVLEEIEMPELSEKAFIPAQVTRRTVSKKPVMIGRSENKTMFRQITPMEEETDLNAAYRRRTKQNVKARESARHYSDAQSVMNARQKGLK